MPVSPQHLKGCDLFDGFTEAGIGIISQIGKLRDVPQGLSIFLEEATGESLFIVHAGEVEILAGGTAQPKRLCVLEKGQHFGGLALVRGGRRQVSARARTACQLVELRRADFNELMKTKPQACFKLMLALFGSIERRLAEVSPLLKELV